jgi:hypothetical protein
MIVLDEGFDLAFEITGQEVVLQEDAVLQGLVPPLDLPLGLGMERVSSHMIHAIGVDIVGKILGDITGAIVAEQARPVLNMSLIVA